MTRRNGSPRFRAPQPTVTSPGDGVGNGHDELGSLTFVVTEHSPIILSSRLGSIKPLQLPQLSSAMGISNAVMCNSQRSSMHSGVAACETTNLVHNILIRARSSRVRALLVVACPPLQYKNSELSH